MKTQGLKKQGNILSLALNKQLERLQKMTLSRT